MDIRTISSYRDVALLKVVNFYLKMFDRISVNTSNDSGYLKSDDRKEYFDNFLDTQTCQSLREASLLKV